MVGNRAGPLIALLRQMRVTRYMRYIYAICVKKICYRTRERQREVVRDGDRVRIVDTRKSAGSA